MRSPALLPVPNNQMVTFNSMNPMKIFVLGLLMLNNCKQFSFTASKRGGIRLTDESGVITSPGYPNGYPNSIAFIWLINTTISKYVELTFLDFDVEPYKDCGVDYVKIRNKKPEKNGNFEDVPQIGKFRPFWRFLDRAFSRQALIILQRSGQSHSGKFLYNRACSLLGDFLPDIFSCYPRSSCLSDGDYHFLFTWWKNTMTRRTF